MPGDRQSLSYQKELLSGNLSSIQNSFDVFKVRDGCDYMGVYFTSNDKPYITFSDTNDFRPSIRISRSTNYLAFTYSTSGDFTSQTTAFLA